MTFEEAKRIFAALLAENVDFVVIGSMAMAAHGLPRATQDLDLFISPSPSNIEALKRALMSLYADPSIEEIDPEELAGEYPAIQYVPPRGEYSLDFITRLGEAFSWENLEAGSEDLKLEELVVRVASARMLYEMKKNTVRLQDKADAARIKETFGLEDD
jgi:hypothetical protein